MQWRLKENGWRFLNSRKIITVFTFPKWQCTECHHQNRSMMVGGEYVSLDRADRRCALCYFDAEHDEKHVEDMKVTTPCTKKWVRMYTLKRFRMKFFSDFEAIGLSQCRKWERFDPDQLSFALDRYVFW